MKEADKIRELLKEGYHPFGWGDFWRTGMTARAARRQMSGWRVDGGYRRYRRVRWHTTPGPRGGTWIKYVAED